MARILVIVASGPEQAQRALEGLHLGQAIHQQGMAEAVEILLTGPGVGCLSTAVEAAELREALEDAVEAGVGVAACTRSLAREDLFEAAAELPEVRPVGAPTRIATASVEGWTVLTF